MATEPKTLELWFQVAIFLGAPWRQEPVIKEMLYKDRIPALAFQEKVDRGSGEQSREPPAHSATPESVNLEIGGWEETRHIFPRSIC